MKGREKMVSRGRGRKEGRREGNDQWRKKGRKGGGGREGKKLSMEEGGKEGRKEGRRGKRRDETVSEERQERGGREGEGRGGGWGQRKEARNWSVLGPANTGDDGRVTSLHDGFYVSVREGKSAPCNYPSAFQPNELTAPHLSVDGAVTESASPRQCTRRDSRWDCCCC